MWEELVQGVYLPGVRYEEDLLFVVTERRLIVSRGVDAVLVRRRPVRTAVVSAARLWRWIYIKRDGQIMSLQRYLKKKGLNTGNIHYLYI